MTSSGMTVSSAVIRMPELLGTALGAGEIVAVALMRAHAERYTVQRQWRQCDGGSLFPVACSSLAFIGQMPRGPEKAAGDEVEITGISDGVVVVADGGAEDAGVIG